MSIFVSTTPCLHTCLAACKALQIVELYKVSTLCSHELRIGLTGGFSYQRGGFLAHNDTLLPNFVRSPLDRSHHRTSVNDLLLIFI